MARKEELQVQSPDMSSGPPVDVIRELKSQRFIKDGSPFWWSTDYAPDPHEYLPFSTLRNKLVHLGEAAVTNALQGSRRHRFERDVYLYPGEHVPISIVNLSIDGKVLPFMVTARPYHENEFFSNPPAFFIKDHPLPSLRRFIRSGGALELPSHFYPHIRGLFAGKRGNHFFWYPLRPYPEGSDFDDVHGFEDVRQALEKINLSFFDIYNYGWDPYSYRGVFDELKQHRDLVDLKNAGSLKHLDFSYEEVSAEEFIEDHQKDKDLLVYYPLRIDGFERTLPFVITNKTHGSSYIRRPVIIGVFADNEGIGYTRHRGIVIIRDRSSAQLLAQSISQEFGIPVDALLYTPQKGRPKYERVEA